MALRLWTGPSGSGKTRFLFEYVLKEAREHRNINYYVIVPEQFTLSTQKELIRLSSEHGILNVDVLSFARLAYRIFEEVGFKDAKGKSIDDMGKNLILRHLASKCEGNLTVFNGKMDRLGYITEVKSMISEFMQYGISADKVSEMAEEAKRSGRGQLAAKLSDLSYLYSEFYKYIDEKYITKEEILSKASRSAYKSQKLKKSVVVFDGFTGFTPVQYSFIEALLTIAHDIHVTILTDKRDNITYNTEHSLFYLGYKTSEKLKKLAELNNIQVENDFDILEEVPRRFLKNNDGNEPNDVTSEMLVHLERNLFRETGSPFEDKNKITGANKLPTKVVKSEIRVFSALQPIDEVRKVAVEIENLIRNGVRYRNIAIATGDLEDYSPIIKRVFREYNIPYFIDKTQPVLINPLIEYIRAIISVITENFSYSAVFRYLRSPLAEYKTCDIDKLENFVIKYGIKGFKSWNINWVEKYDWYFKNRREDDVLFYQNELISLDCLREKIVKELFEASEFITCDDEKEEKVPTKAVNEINTVFTRVFEGLEIEKAIEKLVDEYSKTDVFFEHEHKKEYEKIFGLVLDLMERLEELLPDEKITIKEYGELLDAGFDEIRIGLIPTITDYIQIGDVTRSRFENVHTLFIVGANDGIIPRVTSSNGIISDIEKEFLISNTPDIELSPTVREKAYSGQLYLYMLMTKPTNQLTVSFSRLNNNSESMKPSYIIKVLKDMFPFINIERDFENPYDRVYSLNTLYDVVSENIRDRDYEQFISELINNSCENADDFKKSLRMVADASYMDGVLKGSDTISKAVAGVLYGKAIIGSVTRLEKYAECSFSYFLQYGLSLKEREIFSFEAKDMGTVFHGVLEKYSKYVCDEGVSWTDISSEHRSELVNRAINECMDDPKYAVLSSSSRHKYMLERINRISGRSIEVLTKHLEAGKFIPKAAEISFSAVNSLDAFTFKLSDDEVMRLSGTIDRLDVCDDGEGHVYIKVIDYKSGNKSLNLIQVYKGLSLQLVVYLNAARELILRDSAYSGKEIIPAGILYYHIEDPLVEGSISESDEAISEKIIHELKMKGLVNSDKDVYTLMDDSISMGPSDIIPVEETTKGELSKRSSVVSSDDFNMISEYVNRKIQDIGGQILSGNIKAEPHTENGIDEKACEYCQYREMCKFDGNKSSYLEADGNNEGQTVNKDNVLDAIRDYLEENEGEEES